MLDQLKLTKSEREKIPKTILEKLTPIDKSAPIPEHDYNLRSRSKSIDMAGESPPEHSESGESESD